MMALLKYTVILVVLCLTCGEVLADETSQPSKEEILRNFFYDQGIEFNKDDNELVDRYPTEVIEEMKKLRESLNENSYYPEAQKDDGDINRMIYVDCLKHKPEAYKYDPIIDAQLDALDLIVPNSPSDPIFEKAKKELRALMSTQRNRGEELLNRIYDQMKNGEFYTYEAIRFLRNAYYNWIPLADLAKLFDEQ